MSAYPVPSQLTPQFVAMRLEELFCPDCRSLDLDCREVVLKWKAHCQDRSCGWREVRRTVPPETERKKYPCTGCGKRKVHFNPIPRWAAECRRCRWSGWLSEAGCADIDSKAWEVFLRQHWPKEYGEPQPAGQPCLCLPGSETGRVEVMAARHARGESLWHPLDVDEVDAAGRPIKRHPNGEDNFLSFVQSAKGT